MFRRISSSSREDDAPSLESPASQSSHRPAVRLCCSSFADTPACRTDLRAASRLRISLWAIITASWLFSSASKVVVFPATAGSEAAKFAHLDALDPSLSTATLLCLFFSMYVLYRASIRGFKTSIVTTTSRTVLIAAFTPARVSSCL